MTVQTGLCRTWSEILIVGFLTQWFINKAPCSECDQSELNMMFRQNIAMYMYIRVDLFIVCVLICDMYINIFLLIWYWVFIIKQYAKVNTFLS